MSSSIGASSFGFPLALWLRGKLRPLMQRVTDESRLAEAGVFRREEMARLLNEHCSGANDHNYRLWMIFNLEIFWRHYMENIEVGELEEWIANSAPREPMKAVAV